MPAVYAATVANTHLTVTQRDRCQQENPGERAGTPRERGEVSRVGPRRPAWVVRGGEQEGRGERHFRRGNHENQGFEGRKDPGLVTTV